MQIKCKQNTKKTEENCFYSCILPQKKCLIDLPIEIAANAKLFLFALTMWLLITQFSVMNAIDWFILYRQCQSENMQRNLKKLCKYYLRRLILRRHSWSRYIFTGIFGFSMHLKLAKFSYLRWETFWMKNHSFLLAVERQSFDKIKMEVFWRPLTKGENWINFWRSNLSRTHMFDFIFGISMYSCRNKFLMWTCAHQICVSPNTSTDSIATCI